MNSIVKYKKLTGLVLLSFITACSEAPKQDNNVARSAEEPSFSGVRGQLLGVDGKPMVIAQIHVQTLGALMQKPKQVEVGEDGSYQFDLQPGKKYGLTFKGLAHEQVKYVFDYPKAQDLQMDVNLDYLPMKKNPENVSLFIFSMAQEGTEKPRFEAMTAQGNNLYSVTIDVPISKFRYKIDGVSYGGHLIADSARGPYQNSEYGDFLTVVDHPGGSFTVNYQHQVKQNPLANSPITLTGEWGALKQSILLQQQFGRILSEQRVARKKAKLGDFAYEAGIEQLAKWSEKYKGTIHEDMILAMSTTIKGQSKEVQLQAFKTLDGKSPWLYLPEVNYGEMISQASRLGFKQENEGEAVKAYTQFYLDNIDKVNHYLRYFADDDAKSQLVAMLAYRFKSLEDAQNYRDLYTMLKERYSHVANYSYYMKMLAPPSVPSGQLAPKFNIASMINTDVSYNNEDFKGKVLLLDFWATWCTPCLKEMPDLHHAYQQFNPQGFEILSLSADINASDVTNFIKGKWKMPWHHAFLDGGEHQMVNDYGVFGYPAAFLVNEQGVVIATGDKVRGEKLIHTLTDYFAKK